MNRSAIIALALAGPALAACSRTEAPKTGDTVLPLAAYAGRYPSEQVGARRWHDDPRVIAAVNAAVPDPAVRARVLSYPDPQTPIARVEGELVAAGCDLADCAARNWEVFIDPTLGAARVCDHDAARSVQGSVWYRAGASPVSSDGRCAIGEGGSEMGGKPSR